MQRAGSCRLPSSGRTPLWRQTSDTSNRFVLEVYDCTRWCPIAQAPFYPTDVGPLRSILALEAADDAELNRLYFLDDDQIAAIVSAFGTFDPRQLDDDAAIEIRLFRLPGTIEAPYLVHTNWELPLLLEGRKKLAVFSDLHPSPLFDCEEAFDRWVANGVLHKKVIDEPFEEPTRKRLGDRTVYYTPRARNGAFPLTSLSRKHRESPAAGTSTSNGSKVCCSAMRTGRTTGGSRPT
jgi:hypothetical protein